MTSAVALALGWLVAGADMQLDAGVQVEGRGRLLSNNGQPDEWFLEALAIPRVAITRSDPDLLLAAAYAPRLRAPDLLAGTDLVLLHAAELQAVVRPGTTWSLSGIARGERGTTDLLSQSRLTDSGLETITTTGRLRYRSLRGDLALVGRTDPRTSLSLTASAFVTGGEGAAAEETYPLQRGASAGASWTWTASRLDHLSLRLTSMGTRLERGPTSAVATLDAGWRRRLSRAVEAWISAGATGTYEDPRGDTAARDVLPAGEIGVAHTPPPPTPTEGSGTEERPVREAGANRISSQATLTLSSSIDRAAGSVDPQLAAAVRASWPVTPRWSLSGGALGAIVWQEPGRTRRGRLDALASWLMTARLRFGLGLYGTWQRASAPELPSFTEAGAFLSVGLDARPIQF